MKKSTFLNLLILAVVTITGCDKEASKNESEFPLSGSNSWQYITETDIDSSVSSFISYWQIINNSSINGIAVTKVSQRDSFTNTGAVRQAYSYYHQATDGLYGIASENSGSSFFFKTEEENWPLMNSFPRSANKTDSLFIPDTALYLLRYPVVLNDIWRSNEYGPGANTKREWIGTETITTPAGTFTCDKLRIILDFNDNSIVDADEVTIVQHFSDKGLIQEEQFRILTNLNGDTIPFHRLTRLTQINF